MKTIVTVILVLISGFTAIGQSQTHVEYTQSDKVMANPERGFYKHTETHTDSYNSLRSDVLQGYRTSESITQILRVFYLEAFRDRPISQDYLSNMQADFSAARTAGVKVIVRFAYSQGTTAPYNDAQPETVFTHIQQLQDVLRQNADVIAVMQAGFVGTWGEWYYTDGFAGNFPSDVSDQNWADRSRVVDELLNALPEDRMVQIRTPGYKMIIYDTESPLTLEEAHTGVSRSRVGHHNDCFVASSNDFGTYVNPDVEKPYLELETTYLPMGGETCSLAPPYSDCDNSTSELERFHWSYLNIDYNTTVLNEWTSQGCFDEVELRLGYRFVMESATISSGGKPSGEFTLNLDLSNQGYSSPYNPRDVEIVLKNTSTLEEYAYETDEDPRFWPLGSFSIHLTAGLPVDIAHGNYKVYLKLGDPYPALANDPSFAIQMANDNVWDPELGYNDLKVELTVSDTISSAAYSGTEFFEQIGIREMKELPTQLYGGASGAERILFWGAQDGFLRVIERSINGADFDVVAEIDGNTQYFKDTEYTAGASYTYRFQLQDSRSESQYSNSIDLTHAGDDFVTIVADGADADWQNVSSLVSSVNDNNETFVVRAFFDVSRVNFIIYGDVKGYEIYLNTDNNAETGLLSDDEKSGMDYLIEDLKVYALNEEDISEKAVIQNQAKTDSTIEFSFDLAVFENLGSNTAIGLFALLNDVEKVGVDQNGSAARLFRQPSPDAPDTLYALNPLNDKTSIELIWSACQFCDRYEIQRSLDGTNFDVVATLGFAETDLIDRGLTPGENYYYRISSINDLGYSDYSSMILVKAGGSPLSVQNAQNLTIYPNPSQEWINLNAVFDHLAIVDMSGKYQVVLTPESVKIDIRALQSGVYFIQGWKGEQIWSGRFVKN